MGKQSEKNHGRKYSRIPIVCTFFSLILMLCLLVPTTASAQVAPDTITIHSVNVSRNLGESGDMLFTVHYELNWDDEADVPDEAADEVGIIQLLSTDKSHTIAAITPYPFVNSGYGEGVASFYFSADQVGLNGLTWYDPYVVRIATQPGYMGTITTYDYVLPSSDYCSSSETDTNQTWLKDWVIETAQSLESDWEVSAALTEVSVDMVLSSSGEAYFLRVIPGLRELSPDLFTVNVRDPDYTPPAWGDDHEEAVEGQWTDTWIGDALDGLGDLLGGGNNFLVMNIVCLGGVLGLMAVSYGKFEDAMLGFMLGLMCLPIAVALGFLEVAVMAVITVLAALYLAATLFWNRAG